MQEGKLDSVAWSTMPACPDLGLWAQVVRVVLASGGGKEGGAPVELIAGNRGGAMLSSVGAHAPTPKYKFSVNQQIFTIEIIGQAANPWTVHPPPFSSSFAPGQEELVARKRLSTGGSP